MHEIQENRIKSVKVWLSFKKQDAVDNRTTCVYCAKIF